MQQTCTIIAEIGVMVVKIWAFKAFWGQNSLFRRVLGFFLKFWKWSEDLGTKDRALAKCGIFSGILGQIFGVFDVART
jgi:hypothetical protein